MSDVEEPVVEPDAEDPDAAGPKGTPATGGTDQGPYTGQSMDIPTEPYNPASGMTPEEVQQGIDENIRKNAEGGGDVEAVEADADSPDEVEAP